jgi:hypothetical protein
MTTGTDPFPYVVIPDEAREQPCACREEHCYLPERSTMHFDEGNGAAQVDLVCPAGNGCSSVHYWTPSDQEFEATFKRGFDDETDEIYDGADDDGHDHPQYG